MPIEKGADWGTLGHLPDGAPTAETDAELATMLQAGVSVAGLGAGDLARTLGIGPARHRRAQNLLLPVDAVDVTLDGHRHIVCVAHTVIGALHRSRRVVAIMNAAFIGRLNVAPRAHPGDGVVDVVTIELGLADRVKARRRMATGSHVPHPGIAVNRSRTGAFEFRTRPQPVRVDGRRVGRARRVEFTVRGGVLTIGV